MQKEKSTTAAPPSQHHPTWQENTSLPEPAGSFSSPRTDISSQELLGWYRVDDLTQHYVTESPQRYSSAGLSSWYAVCSHQRMPSNSTQRLAIDLYLLEKSQQCAYHCMQCRQLHHSVAGLADKLTTKYSQRLASLKPSGIQTYCTKFLVLQANFIGQQTSVPMQVVLSAPKLLLFQH